MLLSESRPDSLRSILLSAGNLARRFLWSNRTAICLGDLIQGSVLNSRTEELRGRSVLIATTDQLPAGLAVLELDGIASRIVLCPADIAAEHFPAIIDVAQVDAIVSDGSHPALTNLSGPSFFECSTRPVRTTADRSPSQATQWILLTSGTTGRPKLVTHTLLSLAAAINFLTTSARPVVWSTFYDIRRYGGLQIFLRAIFGAGSMVLSDAQETPGDFLGRSAGHQATHMLGTPSHWRRALMSPAAQKIAPQYVRLSGEIVDQPILNQLSSCYPGARLAHAFASTEAGVAFEVNDGLAGFPETVIRNQSAGVEIKIDDGSLRIRSGRTASCYLGNENSLKDADGFVDTRDMVELRGDRYYFVGRRDGVINVGGFKVHPEEVEVVINRHPHVRMSLVRQKKNPITGAVVVADIVLDQATQAETDQTEQVKRELLQFCHNHLPNHKVPAQINFVPALSVAATGKMARNNA